MVAPRNRTNQSTDVETGWTAEAISFQPTWEYELVIPQPRQTDSDLVTQLNVAGAQGWEVCGMLGRSLIVKRVPRDAPEPEPEIVDEA